VHTASEGLSVEQQQFQQLALEFARQELAPNMKQWDEHVSPIDGFHSIFCHRLEGKKFM